MGNVKTKYNSGIVIGKIKNKEIKLLNGPYGYYINYNNKNKNIKSYLEWKKKEKDDLTIEDCKTIVKYPKKIGTHNKKSINICIGKYGYYMEYNKKFYKIPQDENKWDLELLKRKIKV
jgi:topoisomerase IA-like protein